MIVTAVMTDVVVVGAVETDMGVVAVSVVADPDSDSA